MTPPRTDADMRAAVQAVMQEDPGHTMQSVAEAIVRQVEPATDDEAERLRDLAARVYAEMQVGMMG